MVPVYSALKLLLNENDLDGGTDSDAAPLVPGPGRAGPGRAEPLPQAALAPASLPLTSESFPALQRRLEVRAACAA